MRIGRITIMLLALALAGPAIGQVATGRSAAGPQSGSQLLEKATYYRDTVGDTDAAIKIYRQMIGSGSESRSNAAQAQYGLAMCLLKKGDRAEAIKAFEKLAQNYPEEKELVARARKYTPDETTLLSVPWAETELSEMRLKYAGGTEIGTWVDSIEPSTAVPQNSMIRLRVYTDEGSRRSAVEIDANTMRPVSSSFISPMLGDYKINYEGSQARLQVRSGESKVIALDGPVFDNEEALFLFRRLPLAPGYKTLIPFLSPSGTQLKVSASVIAVEDVQVPAGTFHCYKLDVPRINQTFWIGTDGSRPLVKFESGGAVAELVNVRKIDRQTPVDYKDGKVGIAITAAPGWMFHPKTLVAKDETDIVMLDPEARAVVEISAKNVKTDQPTIVQQLHDDVDKKVEVLSGILKDFHIRAGSMQALRIGGAQALSGIADYLSGERKKVKYLTWARSENTSSFIAADMEASDLDQFRKRFDSILETVQLK